jgi:hypothetical protein
VSRRVWTDWSGAARHMPPTLELPCVRTLGHIGTGATRAPAAGSCGRMLGHIGAGHVNCALRLPAGEREAALTSAERDSGQHPRGSCRLMRSCPTSGVQSGQPFDRAPGPPLGAWHRPPRFYRASRHPSLPAHAVPAPPSPAGPQAPRSHRQHPPAAPRLGRPAAHPPHAASRRSSGEAPARSRARARRSGPTGAPLRAEKVPTR